MVALSSANLMMVFKLPWTKAEQRAERAGADSYWGEYGSACLYCLGSACQEGQYPLTEDAIELKPPQLHDELEEHYSVECQAVVSDKRCHVYVLLVQLWKHGG